MSNVPKSPAQKSAGTPGEPRPAGASAQRPPRSRQTAPEPDRAPSAERRDCGPRAARPPRARIAPNPVPPITFPESLPVSGKRDEIARAIAAHQVVIVCGETGSGKTTQLPKICLALGRGLGAGGSGLIGHTQPRRLAASSTGRRIAEELGTPFGEVVGYKVRFTDNLAPGASVKLMTDGILLAETQTDPLLKAYDTLIIDEAHERSLNIDFLLGYLKQILPKRPELKLIVTSATIDADRFARHFGSDERPAPVIEVSGRLYPVELRYRPIADDRPAAVRHAEGAGSGRDRAKTAREAERDLMDGIVDAVDELCREGPGDVLVFLAGEREIRDAAEALRKHHPPHTEILPLFARLSAAEQERVFKPSNARRIVLATNVAETSLTVPGIRYVVDTGLARVKRYSYRNKVEQLQIESVSQAAANQRAGRCGRVADGICIRLYEESDFAGRARFTDPEILRSSLASVILRMKSLHLSAIESFPFIEPPPGRAIADGYQLLNELGAVDDDNALTPLGRELARLPLDPRVGRMILAARDQQALREVLVIASALSVQDPRDRPLDAQEQADQAHRRFADERSEFVQWLRIWAWFEEAVAHKKSNRQLVDACRQNFLSHLRLREWRDVHSQLLTVVREHGWRLNEAEATFEQIHLSLLTGLLGNIGFKADDEPHYLGARGIKFHLWPGSALVKKAGRWVMAAELVETSRLYARCIAKIEPEWIERIGAHLLKKSLSEPHWEKRPAQVSAYERATLYGLTVYHRRRVAFGRQDPARARELFIRGALVDGEFDTKLAFFAHNRKLLADIEQLEHKSRRQDVLVDDALIHAFYDQAIAQGVHTGAAFERWYRDEVRKSGQPEDKLRLLYLSRDDLMRHEAAGVTTDLFPKRATMAGVEMALSYHFEPGAPRDGVTLAVPLFALNQVDARRAEWLVPGMLKEKVQLLLKSLPQKLRRHCVPLPEYAAGFVERAGAERFGAAGVGVGGLVEALIADIRAETQVATKTSDFKLETLPAHLFMNFKVIDEHGRQLAMGRNLAQLRAELGAQAQQHFQKIAAAATLAPAGDGAGRARRRVAAGRGAVGGASGRGRRRRDGALREPHDVELRQAAGAARDPPARRDAVRLSGARRSRHALRRRGVRFARGGGADSPRGPQTPVRAAAQGADQVSGEEPAGAARDGDAVHVARHAGRAARPADRDGARSRVPAGAAARRRRELPRAPRRGPEPPEPARAGDRAARRADPRRIRGAREEARAGEAVPGRARGHAGPARGARRQALRRRHALRAACALPALPEGSRAADRQAEGRSRPRCAPVRRAAAARAALSALGRAARRRGGRAARRVPVAPRGAADLAFRTGVAHADAGVGQAALQSVGVDAALNAVQSMRVHTRARDVNRRRSRAFYNHASPRRESSCAISSSSAARSRLPPPCWRPSPPSRTT